MNVSVCVNGKLACIYIAPWSHLHACSRLLLLRCHLPYNNHSHLYSHTNGNAFGELYGVQHPANGYLTSWLQGSGIKPPILWSVNDPQSHGCPDMWKICVSDLATSMHPCPYLHVTHHLVKRGLHMCSQSSVKRSYLKPWKQISTPTLPTFFARL